MIKGAATILYGGGSVASTIRVDDNNIGVIFMRSVPPGKIGRPVTDVIDPEEIMKKPEVVMYFTNVESLDAQISELNTLKNMMIGAAEEEKE